MKNKNSIHIAEQRSNIYNFLSMVYLKEPGEEFINTIDNKNISALFKEAGLNSISKSKLNTTNIKKITDELAEEYTRLFIGPGKHISLYESVWVLDYNSLWGETTSKVKKTIETTGLNIINNWINLPDHISIEFEFMQKLIESEIDSIKKNKKKLLLKCLEIEKRFINEHLYQWVPQFSNTVIKKSRHPFYKDLAKITNNFIEYDKNYINKFFN